MKKFAIFMAVTSILFFARPVVASETNCSPGSGNEISCAINSGKSTGSSPQQQIPSMGGNNQTQIVNVNVGSGQQPQQEGMSPEGGDRRRGNQGGVAGFLTRLAEGFILKSVLGIPVSGNFGL